MSDSIVVGFAGAGAALIATAGALSKGTLIEIGVALLIAAAVTKYIGRRKKNTERRSGPTDRRHEDNHASAISR